MSAGAPTLFDPPPETEGPGAGGQLLELRLKDFAIVDRLTLALEPGLNALTGETGAGKSILIDALGAILGDRVNAGVVRAGSERAVVEATFSRPPTLPPDLELDDEDDVIILSREIAANGRSSARLNGRSVPLSLLQAAGRALVDVHGQSDHQSLFRPATHLHFLDRFAGLQGPRQQVADLVRELRQVRHELAKLRGDARELAREQDLLRFQVDEIEAAGLAAGEDQQLAARRAVLANAEKLRLAVAAALSALNDDAQAIDAASTAAKHVAEAAHLDPSLQAPSVQLDDAIAVLQDASRTLTRYSDAIEADPAELQRIDDRLDLFRTLKRKYGETIEDVLAFAGDARARLNTLLAADERMEQCQADEQRLLIQAWAAAESLSTTRRGAAEELASRVESELADLNMRGARFIARVQARGRRQEEAAGNGREQEQPASNILLPTGIDDVEFLLAANPAEPLRPLAQVASGGEASRLMLALKSVFSAVDDTPVLVFDEIEVGVGARGGHMIGRKLRQLARHHQVLCITHLAPVAAMAGVHFKVRKLISAERTTTAVDRVDGATRLEELAEMLAGQPVTAAARASARELLAGG